MLRDIDSGVCPYCRFQNEEGALICDSCAIPFAIEILPPGEETGPEQVSCPFCLFQNDAVAIFCEMCQSNLAAPANPPRRDKKQRWGLWCPFCLFRNDEESLFCERCTSDVSTVAPSRQ